MVSNCDDASFAPRSISLSGTTQSRLPSGPAKHPSALTRLNITIRRLMTPPVRVLDEREAAGSTATSSGRMTQPPTRLTPRTAPVAICLKHIHSYRLVDVNAGLFRLLGDEARLRILRLLAAERLNVSELT